MLPVLVYVFCFLRIFFNYIDALKLDIAVLPIYFHDIYFHVYHLRGITFLARYLPRHTSSALCFVGWMFLYLVLLTCFAFSCSCMWQTYNELQHCFLTVGLVYPEDLFVFLLNVGIISEREDFQGSLLCVIYNL